MAEHHGRGLAEAVPAALLDDPGVLRGVGQDAVPAILEAEMAAHLGAGRDERSAGRTGYRNGSKPRRLRTRVGTLERDVPQDREGTFATEVFGRYQRTEQALVVTWMEMYVPGVSTRKVATITEQLCGASFSKSQVSALTGTLDTVLAAWRERPVTVSSPDLSGDARYEHVRVDGHVVSQGVLIVAGVRDDGRRELLPWRWPTRSVRRPPRPCSGTSKDAGCGAWGSSPVTTTPGCGRRSRATSRGRPGSAARCILRATCGDGWEPTTAPGWGPPSGGRAIRRWPPPGRRSWRTVWPAMRSPLPTGSGCARRTAGNGSTRN